MNPILSIIVPVYNAAPFLEDCVRSILASSLESWELLLVDDGSTDGSGALVDALGERDSRIRVFHKPNGGVSSARNLALDEAVGEWVAFVDADDFVSEGYFEGLLSAAKDGVDFVHGGCTEWTSKGRGHIISSFENSRSSDTASILKRMEGYAVSKLYRLSIIRARGLRFDERMNICEDMAFTYSYLPFISAHATVSECGYFYRRDNANGALNSESRCFETRMKNFAYLMEAYDAALKELGMSYEDAPKQSAHKASYIMSALITLGPAMFRAQISPKEARMLRFYKAPIAKKLASIIIRKRRES